MTCEETSDQLLPDETTRCCITGKRVGYDLLAESEASGTLGLATLMQRCAISGKRLLPEELQTCSLTGDRVLPDFLQSCVVTGRRARRDRMVRSDESKGWMLPDQAVRSVIDGQVGAPSEMTSCEWREGHILRSQARTCRRTGLTFSEDLISNNGEFIILIGLLNGELEGDDASDLVTWLSQRDGKVLRAVKAARSISSPSGGMRAVCVELRTMLGLKVRHAGMLVRDKGDRELVGRVTVGHRDKEGWRVEEDVTVGVSEARKR